MKQKTSNTYYVINETIFSNRQTEMSTKTIVHNLTVVSTILLWKVLSRNSTKNKTLYDKQRVYKDNNRDWSRWKRKRGIPRTIWNGGIWELGISTEKTDRKFMTLPWNRKKWNDFIKKSTWTDPYMGRRLQTA